MSCKKVLCSSWAFLQFAIFLACQIVAPSSAATFGFGDYSDDEHDDHIMQQNRQFSADCKCVQKLRTNYIVSDYCGQAALCYWEIWNYNKVTAGSKNETYDEECDRYMVQKYACLIGYPKPQLANTECQPEAIACDKKLAKLLYDDCEPLREEFGYPKPEDLDLTLTLDSLNYDMTQNDETIFRSRPSPEQPLSNNYYIISCPLIYRFPFFTIDLLLKHLDPALDYDETKALVGVGEMLPQFLREGINNERILNFDALALDQSMIHWCGIPKNYICVKEELDPDNDVCSDAKLAPLKAKCPGGSATRSSGVASDPSDPVDPNDP